MTYASTEDLAVALEDGVLRLTLSRPHKKNALTDAMVHALIDHLGTANLDDDVRAILVDAEGPTFCVGSDIVARNAGTEKPRTGKMQRRLPGHAHRLIPMLRDVQLPVVCAAQGWTVGLGLAVALAADFLVVSDDVRLWAPFSTRGISPDSGVSWMLPQRVGVVRARQMLLLGRELDAETAVEWGLAHDAAPRENLGKTSAELARQLAAAPTVATGMTKWLVNQAGDNDLRTQLQHEAFCMELAARTKDFREGFRAFREKRPPEFIGK